MTPPKTALPPELVDAIAALAAFGDSATEQLARIDERMTTVEANMEKIMKALYGNGEPGIRETTRDLAKRMAAIEEKDKTCPINRVATDVEAIKDAHKEAKEAREKTGIENRRFFYGIITLILTILGDIALRLFGGR